MRRHQGLSVDRVFPFPLLFSRYSLFCGLMSNLVLMNLQPDQQLSNLALQVYDVGAFMISSGTLTVSLLKFQGVPFCYTVLVSDKKVWLAYIHQFLKRKLCKIEIFVSSVLLCVHLFR